MRAGVAVAFAAAVAGCGGHPSATRPPTALERAALTQAIFDSLPRTEAADPSIARIRVTTVPSDSRGAAPYTEFARVDLTDPKVGDAMSLLGYRQARVSGWRLLDLGSADVGCSFGPGVFGSHKQVVLHDLGLDCPGA